MSFPKRTYLLILVSLSFLYFLFALRTHLYFSLDDFAVLAYFRSHSTFIMIRQFLSVGDIWGFHKIMGYLNLKLLFLFFGVSPLPYIINNQILHTVNVILLFLVIDHFSKDSFKAFFCALIFNSLFLYYFSNVHEYLVTLLSLLSTYLYLKLPRVWPSLLFFLLALLTKEVAVFVPLILLSLSLYQKKTVKPLRPFFILAFVYGVYQLTFLITKTRLSSSHPYAVTADLLTLWHNLVFYLPVRWLILLGGSLFFAMKRRTWPLFLTALLTLAPALILRNRQETYYFYLPLAVLCLYLSLTLPRFNLKSSLLYLAVFMLLGGRTLLPPLARQDYPNRQKNSIDQVLLLVESRLKENPRIKEIPLESYEPERDAYQMLVNNDIDLFLSPAIASRYHFSFVPDTNTIEVVY